MAETIAISDLQTILKKKFGDYVIIKEQRNEIILKKLDEKELPTRWNEIFSKGEKDTKNKRITKRDVDKACYEVRHGK